jgi:hypothetical protein
MIDLPTALENLVIKSGMKVFPCSKKIPLTKNGFKDASSEPKQVLELFKNHKNAQIGVPTGRVNNLVVLDVDGPEGEAWLRGKSLPDTRKVETSLGRYQYWFKLPEGRTAKSSAGVLAPQVDVRGEGGYVIAPPSIHHESGKPYRFVNQLPGAIAPDWLLEPANGHKPQPVPATPGMILQGQGRHREILKIAGALRRQGLTQDAILHALTAINTERCSPPLEPKELERLSRYIGTKPSGEALEAAVAEVEIESFVGLVPEKVEWLWPHRIPFRKLTIFGGDPGMGKSLVTLDVASRLSTDRSFCDGAAAPRADSLFLTAEDGTFDTVLPRLIAAGADLARIHRIKAVKVTLPDGAVGESHFSLDRDLEKLDEALEKLPQVRLVVIDPISAYMGKVDTHKDAEVRRVLTPVAGLAERRKIAIVAVMHPKKSEASALHRLSGSIGFTAAARAVWGFGEDPDDPTKRVMVPIKHNLAGLCTGLAYRITASGDGSPFIVWEKDPVSLDADEVLNADPKEKRARAKRRGEAEDWLRNLLANGPMPSEQVEAEGKKAGFSWGTLRRAKEQIGFKARKAGFAGGWIWELATQKEDEL